MKIFISAGHHKDEKKTGLGHEEVVLNMLMRDECLKLMPDLISVPDDLTLRQTIDWINARTTSDDFALEIHCNANNDGNIRGVETYFYKNEVAAKLVGEEVSRATGLPFRGTISDTKSYFGELGFLRQVKCDNTLVEVGYLTNRVEREVLLKHETHRKVAEGIRNAFIQIGLVHEKKKDILGKLLELYQKLFSMLRKR